jgi:hypothetical protein
LFLLRLPYIYWIYPQTGVVTSNHTPTPWVKFRFNSASIIIYHLPSKSPEPAFSICQDTSAGILHFLQPASFVFSQNDNRMLSYFANTSCKCLIGTSLNVGYLLQSTTDGLLLSTSGLKINTSQLEEKGSTPFTSPFASRHLVSSQS